MVILFPEEDRGGPRWDGGTHLVTVPLIGPVAVLVGWVCRQQPPEALHHIVETCRRMA